MYIRPTQPLNLQGLSWAIMSEIGKAEALAPAGELRSSVVLQGTIVIVFALLLGVGVGVFAAWHIGAPIDMTVATLRNIAEDDGDLTKRLDEKRKDEIDELGHYFNLFSAAVQDLVSRLLETSTTINNSSENLEKVAVKTSASIENQHNQTEQIASAITEMRATIEEVARNTHEA
jgi:methyl-accepting chemotaxis protein